MDEFRTENVWLSMLDGVHVSTTLTIPILKYSEEKFSVLLEYKPYRTDDILIEDHHHETKQILGITDDLMRLLA
jgi:hypothetical protein